MARTLDYSLCPKYERSFEILGKKWNGLIIDVLLAEKRVRFSELANCIPKCSDRVLSERLSELEEAGVINRVVETCESRPVYTLTDSGKDLSAIVASVHAWAEKWCGPCEKKA